MRPGDLHDRLAAVVRALLLAGQGLLQPAQPPRGLAQKSRHRNCTYTGYAPYAARMSTTRTIGARDARPDLGKLVDAAHYAGQHTVITKAGQPRAVLVPYEWWNQQQNRPT
jgi:prevent-host-death family protein